MFWRVWDECGRHEVALNRDSSSQPKGSQRNTLCGPGQHVQSKKRETCQSWYISMSCVVHCNSLPRHASHVSWCLLAGDAAFAYTIPCKWTSDQNKVILEIQSETSKACQDSEPTTIQSLLHGMEEEGVVDCGLNGHTCARPDSATDRPSTTQTLCRMNQKQMIHSDSNNQDFLSTRISPTPRWGQRLLRDQSDPEYSAVPIHPRVWKYEVFNDRECIHQGGASVSPPYHILPSYV